MGEHTGIAWTDHTFNGWEGCSKVSAGCANCYAETRNKRYFGGANWGKGAPRRRTSVNNWNEPRRWNRAVEACHFSPTRPEREMDAFGWRPNRPRVFCASLSDWLDDEVPTRWRTDLLRLIHDCPTLDWQLLTKRPENFAALMDHAGQDAWDDENHDLAEWIAGWRKGYAPSHVWIGTSVENQACADKRIPDLLNIPARVRFLSCEPLLGEVKLGMWLRLEEVTPIKIVDGRVIPTGPTVFNKMEESEIFPLGSIPIHWVIAGGESGPGHRRMAGAWAHSLSDQCTAANIPFFMKQDSGSFSGMKGGLPDALWARKEFPV